MTHPYDDRYAAPPGYGAWPDPGRLPPGAWPPPYGYPPPAPRRRNRAAVAWTIAGALLGLVLLGTIAVGGFRMGSAEITNLPTAPETSAPADWSVIGDDEGLDAYAQRCHDGELNACDELYGLAEPGSDYEYYGLTCGGRVNPRDVPFCGYLD